MEEVLGLRRPKEVRNQLPKIKDEISVAQDRSVSCGPSYVAQISRKIKIRLKRHINRKDSEMRKCFRGRPQSTGYGC